MSEEPGELSPSTTDVEWSRSVAAIGLKAVQMSNVEGMDVSAVRQLAMQMTRHGEAIQELMRSLTSALEAAPWVGPDRDRFINTWLTSQCPQMDAVAGCLIESAQLAASKAMLQEQASSS